MTLEFAGDNPCVVLYDDKGAVMSAVSYWNANYSVAGTGRGLFLVSSQSGRLDGRLLVEEGAPLDFFQSLNQHFLGFEAVDWRSINPEKATFDAGWGDDAYAVACDVSGQRIDIGWRGFDKPWAMAQRAIDFGKQPGLSYDIASVIIGAAEGEIRIDGAALPGSVTAPYGALPRSAFLAFCETWTRL